jgi:hypothetical protein
MASPKSESAMINDRDMPTWKLITLKKNVQCGNTSFGICLVLEMTISLFLSYFLFLKCNLFFLS